MARIKKKMGIMSVIAVIFFIIGGCGLILWPSFFNNILKKELALSPESMSYKMWKETPIPMYLKIYLYNWTNPSEVLKNSAIKPNFQQMGPYVFREVNQKVRQKWNNENSTITFQQKRTWHFEPTMSAGTLSDKVTTINPIAVTIAYTVRNRGTFFKKLVNELLKAIESITVTKQVREFLFDGYDDQLLKLALKFNITDNPFDKFGWFYSRNGSETYDGIFNMLTGANNMNEIGMLQEWKYKRVSPAFSSCGPIQGSMGDSWPPLPDNETVSVFSPDICTTLKLRANGKSEWLGVTGSKYISDVNMLDNGTHVDSRKCYCKGVDCQPSGVLNVSSCKFGAPAFISLPHFYLADDIYRENITGMEPNQRDHEFQLVVEPSTGIPMQVRAALQISFLVQPDKKLTYFENIPQMYAPMLWFTQEVNLTSQYADQIKLLLLLPPLGKWISISVILVGVLLVLFSGFIYIRQRRDEMNENLIPKDRDNDEAEVNVNNSEE